MFNGLILIVMFVVGYFAVNNMNGFLAGTAEINMIWFYIVIGIGLLLGILFVIPIGGADMPVIISLLNSYSGIAAAATGFVLQNQALIVSGCLVGASVKSQRCCQMELATAPSVVQAAQVSIRLRG